MLQTSLFLVILAVILNYISWHDMRDGNPVHFPLIKIISNILNDDIRILRYYIYYFTVQLTMSKLRTGVTTFAASA